MTWIRQVKFPIALPNQTKEFLNKARVNFDFTNGGQFKANFSTEFLRPCLLDPNDGHCEVSNM